MYREYHYVREVINKKKSNVIFYTAGEEALRFCNICLSFSKNSLCSRDFTKVFAALDIIVITIIYKNKTHES